jgi:DNA-binding MarR family transcriptional regulator
VTRDGSDQECAAVAMNAVRRIVRALRIAERHSEATHGVSAAGFFVLREIEKCGAPTISELARRTATAQSSVSEVAARLSARGLVTRGRSTTDRRRTEITLSDAGRDLLRNAPEAVQERLLAGFRTLPLHRRRAIAEGLAEWTSMSGLQDIAATMFFEPLEEPGPRGRSVREDSLPLRQSHENRNANRSNNDDQ